MVRRWNPAREDRPRTRQAEEPRNRRASGASSMTWPSRPLPHRRSRRRPPPRPVPDPPRLGQSRPLAGDPHLGLRPQDARRSAWPTCCCSPWPPAACTGCCRRPAARAAAEARWPCCPLLLLSLVLVNAQAVTSLTSERDCRALDLLLVTDLTPKEIVFGKLGGVFYNTKEMVLLPHGCCAAISGWAGAIEPGEPAATCWPGLAVLYVFVAVLGIHAGMIYENSRSADRHQPGHGVLPVPGRGHLHADHGRLQRLVPGPVAAVPGVHGRRRPGAVRGPGGEEPSTAIGVASFVCPFATFYAITSFLLGLHAGRVPGDRGRLRLHHRRDARSGDLRVRRGHRPNDGRMKEKDEG